MKKKIIFSLFILLSIFILKIDVYADCVVGYYCDNLHYNIYNESTKQYEEYEKIFLMYKSKSTNDKTMEGIPLFNNKPTIEAYPKKEGYKFDGWYYDKELTKKIPELLSKIDMNLLTINGYNLYGRWIEGNDDNLIKYKFGENVYKVEFKIYYTGVNPSNEESLKYYDTYYYTYEEALLVFDDADVYLSSGRNNKYYKLPELEEREDADFKGWYLDPKLETEATIELSKLKDYNKSSVITLYGKWYSKNPDVENANKHVHEHNEVLPDSNEEKETDIDDVDVDDDTITIGAIEEEKQDNTLYYVLAIITIGATGIVFILIIGNKVKKDKNKKIINTKEE